jgi:polyphosphate kinase
VKNKKNMSKDNKLNHTYINRELSWLQFNARVLQEAADETVPLIERLRFIGIFSNNLDEFFKVRYATIKRIEQAGKKGKSQLGGIKASELLKDITQTVIKQQSKSLKILADIQNKLKSKNVFIINELDITENQNNYFKDYFYKYISPALVTIILNDEIELPTLIDSAAYLAVRMTLDNDDIQYALIEIPSSIERFIVLPKVDDKDYIIMLDDLLRYFLNDIFNVFDFKSITAHMIKLTRDAELDFDSGLSTSFLKKISDSVKHRESGQPVRFVYDNNIELDTLSYLMNKMKIQSTDSIIPGGRYHNRRDYINFPNLGKQDLLYDKINPLPIKGLSLEHSIFKAILKKDYLLYAPYHTFSYIIKFLREAALDPEVKSIKITIYRLATISHVASALINAVKNGKEVTVSIELQARFDEAANIDYAQQMEAEGIRLIFGVQGLKVHSKMCVIERYEGNKLKYFGFISTGNFNESTANIYTDYTLFTSNQQILKDINRVFDFLNTNYRIFKYKHIITSPHYTETALYKLIDDEIEYARIGKPAFIRLKMNSISNYKIIDKLYEASNAGVCIHMIVRGICCLVPGIPNMSENIEVISIIDKFLEHTRLFIFGNNPDSKIYISSADFMTRNFENRVEVTCPVYDLEIKKELIDTFDICWNDNVKARIIDGNQDNKYKINNLAKVRSQYEIYNYYLEKLNN